MTKINWLYHMSQPSTDLLTADWHKHRNRNGTFKSIGAFLLLFCAGGLWGDSLTDEFTCPPTSSDLKIDHDDFSVFLSRYVRPSNDKINRFAYSQVSSADKDALNNYIDQLSRVVIGRHNQKEQLAFWINLYNALTIKIILDNYPVKSIGDIRSGVFSAGPWNLQVTEIEGKPLTLDDIEHRIIRPIFKDKRIHYAINCGSLGSPNLPKTAYSGANLEARLEKAAKDFINHPRGLRLTGGQMVLSKIFYWYSGDFGSHRELLRHLAAYFSDPSQKVFIMNYGGRLTYDYDWSLNDSQRQP